MSEMTSTLTNTEEEKTSTGNAHQAKAYAARSATSGLAPTSIKRREPGPTDVQIEILFCGVCHSDLHQVRNEWESMMPTVYPCVPGHEIVGRVTGVGSAVKKIQRRRSGRRGLSGGFGSNLPELSRWQRAVLRFHGDLHLQRRRQTFGRSDVRRLFRQHCGG